MLNWSDFLAQQERYEDLLREAEEFCFPEEAGE